MARGLNNWSYKDVTTFLKEHGFSYWEPREGSHEAWGNEETGKIVEPAFHGKSETYPIRTMKMLVMQSGISEEEWRKWAAS